MSKGKILDSLPPTKRANSKYDWDTPALLAQKNVGKIIEAGTHIPMVYINSVRTYWRAPFRTGEGHIAVSMRNSKVEEDGIRYGDVYFEWIPNEEEGK